MRLTAKRVCEFLRKLKKLQSCNYKIERISDKEKLVMISVRLDDTEYKAAGINARLAFEDLITKVLGVQE